jgi:hypothetical protein
VHLILDWAEPVTVEELHEYRKDRQEHTQRTRAGVQPKYD